MELAPDITAEDLQAFLQEAEEHLQLLEEYTRGGGAPGLRITLSYPLRWWHLVGSAWPGSCEDRSYH